MYPAMVVKRRASNDIRVNLYNGITIKELDSGPSCHIPVEFDSKKIGDIAQNMDFSVLEMSKMAVKLRLDSGYRANGNTVFKNVTFEENVWTLEISGHDVTSQLKALHVSNEYICTQGNIRVVLDIVKRLKLCTGVKGTTSKHSQISEVLTYQNDNYKCVKSQGCKRIVSFLGEKQCCNTCRQLQYTGKNSKKDCVEIKFPSNIERADIEALVPNGSSEMVDLLLSQIKNTANRDKRQNKWQKSVIQTCLTLWSRSPKSYETLRSSGMLVLPSEYLLVLYKNCVNQVTGFNDEVLHGCTMKLNVSEFPKKVESVAL